MIFTNRVERSFKFITFLDLNLPISYVCGSHECTIIADRSHTLTTHMHLCALNIVANDDTQLSRTYAKQYIGSDYAIHLIRNKNKAAKMYTLRYCIIESILFIHLFICLFMARKKILIRHCMKVNIYFIYKMYINNLYFIYLFIFKHFFFLLCRKRNTLD